MPTKTKPNHQLVAAFGLLFILTLQPSSLLAQGSLTPPGPPAPTMKTLQQVEPRVPISSAPFTIRQPGSYYLTTNIGYPKLFIGGAGGAPGISRRPGGE